MLKECKINQFIIIRLNIEDTVSIPRIFINNEEHLCLADDRVWEWFEEISGESFPPSKKEYEILCEHLKKWAESGYDCLRLPITLGLYLLGKLRGLDPLVAEIYDIEVGKKIAAANKSELKFAFSDYNFYLATDFSVNGFLDYFKDKPFQDLYSQFICMLNAAAEQQIWSLTRSHPLDQEDPMLIHWYDNLEAIFEKFQTFFRQAKQGDPVYLERQRLLKFIEELYNFNKYGPGVFYEITDDKINEFNKICTKITDSRLKQEASEWFDWILKLRPLVGIEEY